MEPKYLQKPEEFRHLIKTAKKHQNRFVLFLSGGASLRACEMTKVRMHHHRSYSRIRSVFEGKPMPSNETVMVEMR
jgi:hypothetical protein